MAPCTIGSVTKTDCHLTYFSNKKCLHDIQNLSSNEYALLSYRINNMSSETRNGSICNHHKCHYLDYFSRRYKKCCDPFIRHAKKVRDSLGIIDLDTAGNALKYIGTVLEPGNKLCKNCFAAVKNRIAKAEDQLKNTQTEQVNKHLIFILEITFYS